MLRDSGLLISFSQLSIRPLSLSERLIGFHLLSLQKHDFSHVSAAKMTFLRFDVLYVTNPHILCCLSENRLLETNQSEKTKLENVMLSLFLPDSSHLQIRRRYGESCASPVNVLAKWEK